MGPANCFKLASALGLDRLGHIEPRITISTPEQIRARVRGGLAARWGSGNDMVLWDYEARCAAVVLLWTEFDVTQAEIGEGCDITQGRVSQICHDPKHTADPWAVLAEAFGGDLERWILALLSRQEVIASTDDHRLLFVGQFVGGIRQIVVVGGRVLFRRARERPKRAKPRPPERWHSRRTDYQIGRELDRIMGDRMWEETC